MSENRVYVIIPSICPIEMMAICQGILAYEECRDEDTQNVQLINAAHSCHSYCVFVKNYIYVDTVPSELKSRWELVMAFADKDR